MNRKGQLTVGVIILTFVGIIVSLAIFTGGISGPVGTLTRTFIVDNQTVIFPKDGGNITLSGQSASAVLIYNASDGALVPATNYTIWNKVLVNNEFKVYLQGINSSNINYGGRNVNVTYTVEPFGYQSDGGSRAVIGLILIFAALAIVTVALVPALRSGVIDLVGR